MDDVPRRHPHRTVPAWVIIVLGVIGTGAALIWASGLHDETGEALLDEPTSKVLVSMLGAAVTILGLVLKGNGEVKHQVKNSHGTNFRDDLDNARREIADVRTIANNLERSVAHVERAHRSNATATAELREDVQQARREQASNISGLRKDLGRLTDLIIKQHKEKP